MHGPLAKLWDAVHGFNSGFKTALQQLGSGTGEAALAKMIPNYAGATGGPGANQWERAEQVRHYRHWVYASIQFFQRQITSNPPRVAYRRHPDERKQWRQKQHDFMRMKSRGGVVVEPPKRKFVPLSVMKESAGGHRPGEDLEYVDENHPLSELLQNPNGPDTWVTFWKEFILFYKLCGAAYIWKVEGEGGGVAELWIIPTHWVVPVCLGHNRLVDYFLVRPWGASTAALVEFSTEELIEIKDPNPLNKLGAQSPLQANSEIVDQYESVQQARYWSCKNGANVGTLFKLKTGSMDPDDTVLKRFKQRFLADHQGEVKFNAPDVLPPDIEIDRPTADIELAYMQSADQLRDYVVTTCYGLSTMVLGNPLGVPWATFVGELRRVIQFVINPELAGVGSILTEHLAAVDYDPDLRIFWALKSPQDDTQRLAEWTGTPGPAATVNEYRSEILGLEPLDDEQYDHPISPAGMVPGGDGGDFDSLFAGNSEGSPKEDPGSSDNGEFDSVPGEKSKKKLSEKHGQPPHPGLVFDESSHRWVSGTDKPTRDDSSGSSSSESSLPTSADEKDVQRVREHTDASAKTWTPQEKSALSDYATDISIDLNNDLRSGNEITDRDMKDIVKGLDGIFAKTPELDEPVSTFRGVRFKSPEESESFLGKMEELQKSGQTQDHKAYTSTSLDPNVANSFLRGGAGVIVQCECSHGIGMEGQVGVGDAATEKEFLMPRDGKFEVVSVNPGNPGVVKMRQLSGKKDKSFTVKITDDNGAEHASDGKFGSGGSESPAEHTRGSFPFPKIKQEDQSARSDAWEKAGSDPKAASGQIKQDVAEINESFGKARQGWSEAGISEDRLRDFDAAVTQANRQISRAGDKVESAASKWSEKEKVADKLESTKQEEYPAETERKEPELPAEPSEPDEPQEPDEPATDDPGEREQYDKEHAQWQKDHAAWEKDYSQWESDHESWESACEKAEEKADAAHEKEHDRWEKDCEKVDSRNEKLASRVDAAREAADAVKEKYNAAVDDYEAMLGDVADPVHEIAEEFESEIEGKK